MNEFEVDELRLLAIDLDKAGPEGERMCRLIVGKTGFDTVAYGQDVVAVDTGHLKSTISVDFDDDGLGFEVGPTASYGADVEYGTKPHIIKARNAKALHWVDGYGDDVFRRRVHHPGTSPQPYMRPAFDRATSQAERAIEQIGGRLLR